MCWGQVFLCYILLVFFKNGDKEVFDIDANLQMLDGSVKRSRLILTEVTDLIVVNEEDRHGADPPDHSISFKSERRRLVAGRTGFAYRSGKIGLNLFLCVIISAIKIL